LKDWQFNVLFWVGVGGAVLLLIGPELGLDLAQNPQALGGFGAILTYVLTQRISIVRNSEKKREKDERPDKEVGNGL
jgi:hypothetical protein